MQTTFESLELAGTAVIFDVFDSLHLLPPVFDNSLQPIGTSSTFAGPAYTITGEPIQFEGGDRAKLSAIDAMPAGIVAVWSSMDAKGVCCFGDLLASAMRARGCVAAVVDGGVRDASFLEQCGMPVVARYKTPAQGIGRWRVTASQTEVRIRGALEEWFTVMPGDIIVGDADGVIAIPEQLLPQITAKVIEWSRSESGAREEIIAGLPLLAALQKYGPSLEIQRIYPEEKSGIASQTGPSREVPHRRTYEAINFSNLLQARIAANMIATPLHLLGASHQSG